MNSRNVLKAIGNVLEKKLESKSGWGKNEVFLIYKESVIEVLADNLDEVDPLTPDESPNERKRNYREHYKNR
jgi:hypothetical protein